jgi:hypothetical protein
VSLSKILLILKRKRALLFADLYLLFLSTAVFLFRIGTPPAEGIEVYKGCNARWFLPSQFIGNEAREMKESGVNLVASTWPIFIDSSGNPHEVPFFRHLLVLQIQTAHRNGLKFFLNLRAQYGGPGNVRAIPEEVWSNFFPKWNRLVLEYAELAERYGVEMSAPMHEADIGWEILREEESLRGYERASEWGQEILPEIRERYSGEVVWRAGLTQCGLEGN